jgi:hypothetical protein
MSIETKNVWTPDKTGSTDYVLLQFTIALSMIDDSTDPLKTGLARAVQHLFLKIKPEDDLPPELAQRFDKLIATSTAKAKRYENDTPFAATINPMWNKTRWRLASEIVSLKYELAMATRNHSPDPFASLLPTAE